jgi:hypothetical protein
MAFTFPQWHDRTAIDAERSWTATFDSYDQRHDDAYYVVTVHEGARDALRFVVQVSLYWAGDDWTGPAFAERIQREMHTLASAGRTNTTYGGYGTAPHA